MPAMAAQLNIPLQRNEDWVVTLYIRASLGHRLGSAPLDLTGMTLAMQVRDKLTQALVEEAQIVVTDPANGEIEITLKASEGSALAAYGNPIQIANLPYDLRATDGDGLHSILFAGQIVLSRGETIS